MIPIQKKILEQQMLYFEEGYIDSDTLFEAFCDYVEAIEPDESFEASFRVLE